MSELHIWEPPYQESDEEILNDVTDEKTRLWAWLELTDKDTIVLADFNDTTGDSVFDETLRQGLAAQLEQSPLLSLISEERIQQALRLMHKPADTRLRQSPGQLTAVCCY